MSWHLLNPEGRPPTEQVAEVQGLYGAYSFPEKLLQKIWLRGDFDGTLLRTLDGRRVQVRFPGKWNLLGGPDFKGAVLRFEDGPEITGDVELHLQAEDWSAHGHAADRAYDGVVLHVVLFPPPPDHVTQGGRDGAIPLVALLPLLHHDLEQFAADEAVATLANRPSSRIHDELAPLAEEELAALLRRHAAQRWRQKVQFARRRVQRLGWNDACHQAALEILGYRFNRVPMLRIAAAWPLTGWGRGLVEVEDCLAAETGRWSLQGVRPANQPRVRLRQYAAWTQARPDWPAKLVTLGPAAPVPAVAALTTKVRRQHQLGAFRQHLRDELGAGSVGGTRLDTLICDGFLPLLAAEADRDLSGLWFHWYPGDLPPLVHRALRNLGAIGGCAGPSGHGVGQGLLGWLIEREAKR
jgi:hypothetical protein